MILFYLISSKFDIDYSTVLHKLMLLYINYEFLTRYFPVISLLLRKCYF